MKLHVSDEGCLDLATLLLLNQQIMFIVCKSSLRSEKNKLNQGGNVFFLPVECLKKFSIIFRCDKAEQRKNRSFDRESQGKKFRNINDFSFVLLFSRLSYISCDRRKQYHEFFMTPMVMFQAELENLFCQ